MYLDHLEPGGPFVYFVEDFYSHVHYPEEPNVYVDFHVIFNDSINNQIRMFDINQPFHTLDSIWMADSTQVLYDFNQMPGDTLNAYLINKPLILGYIDTISYNGVMRKTLHFPDAFGDDLLIIEGIGSNAGLVTNDDPGFSASQFLWCAFFENESFSSYGECHLSIDNPKELEVTVFPNPFTSELNIGLSNSLNGEVSILDLQGKLCHQEPINSLTSSLNLSSLMTGVYILNLSNNKDEVIAYQKIVKL